jgi:hypothetical protein
MCGDLLPFALQNKTNKKPKKPRRNHKKPPRTKRKGQKATKGGGETISSPFLGFGWKLWMQRQWWGMLDTLCP